MQIVTILGDLGCTALGEFGTELWVPTLQSDLSSVLFYMVLKESPMKS
jgi:hypothetical protein